MICLLLVLDSLIRLAFFVLLLFMYSLYKYLLCTYHMPGTVLGAQDTGANKRDDVFCPPEASILVEQDDQ